MKLIKYLHLILNTHVIINIETRRNYITKQITCGIIALFVVGKRNFQHEITSWEKKEYRARSPSACLYRRIENGNCSG